MQGDTQIAAQAVASANRSYRVQPISQVCAFAWSAHGQSSVAQDRQSQMRCTHLWISAKKACLCTKDKNMGLDMQAKLENRIQNDESVKPCRRLEPPLR